jgi:hypothetical protein
MDAYVQEVRKLENKFSGLEVHHVIWEHNIGADILSKLGSTRAQVPVGVFIQELKQPSIKSSPQITTDTGLQKPVREVMMLQKLTSTSSGTKDYQRGWTQKVQRPLVSCVEAKILS